MSEENLDLAQRAYAAWNREDFEWIADRITEDFFEGVGRGSGAVASLTFAHWIGFREGRLADLRVQRPDEALKAAGLDP